MFLGRGPKLVPLVFRPMGIDGWCHFLLLQPIMFRGEVRLNVEEKKTRAVRERETRTGDDRRDMRRSERGGGPGGPRGMVGGGMMRDRDGRGPPPRGGMAPKPGTGSGRGAGGPGEGR